MLAALPGATNPINNSDCISFSNVKCHLRNRAATGGWWPISRELTVAGRLLWAILLLAMPIEIWAHELNCRINYYLHTQLAHRQQEHWEHWEHWEHCSIHLIRVAIRTQLEPVQAAICILKFQIRKSFLFYSGKCCNWFTNANVLHTCSKATTDKAQSWTHGPPSLPLSLAAAKNCFSFPPMLAPSYPLPFTLIGAIAFQARTKFRAYL